jgi:3-oxoacyl-[acyl-carrier protein] reductase
MIKDFGRLKGKVALVTGAGQGIGRAIAKTFAAEAASVMIADIDENTGEAIAHEIRDSGGVARYVKTDLSLEMDIENMVTFTSESLGRVDIVVNNARPKLSPLPFVESLKEWDLAIDVFLKAPALIAKYALPHLKNFGGGTIINIASVNAFFIAPHQPVSYHVAKAGLVQLTRYLAVEFGPHNIRVNAICPGLVDVQDRGQPLTADPVNRAVTEAIVPLGRATSPEEIAELAVFLCTNAAAYVTGQVLMLDGGETLIDQFHAARKAYNQGKETPGEEG